MKNAKDILKCVVIVNLVVFFTPLVLAIAGLQYSHEKQHLIGAIFLASWFALLVMATIFIFIDWKASCSSFLLLLVMIVLSSLLYPAT